jgi:hypothetical protein
LISLFSPVIFRFDYKLIIRAGTPGLSGVHLLLRVYFAFMHLHIRKSNGQLVLNKVK